MKSSKTIVHTGKPREGLSGDYRAIGRALRDYLGDIASTVGDAVSVEPYKTAAARERMQAWKEIVRKHGVKVPDEGNGKMGNEPNQDTQKPGGRADRT